MSIVKPTVGRKVWYRPSHQDKNVGTETTPPMTVSGDQPLDATVIAVWGDRCINLVIFDIYANKYERRSVTLKQEGDTIPDGMAYAEWMPYQTAQAKKQEAEQAKPVAVDHDSGLSFGAALERLKIGLKIARAGWNGKGMWLVLVPGTPEAVLREGTPYAKALGPDRTSCEILPHIDMWTTNASGRRAMLPGWHASQSDMLAEDWQIVLDAAPATLPLHQQRADELHDSDCSTNNRGVPELLGKCDCSALL